MLRNYECNNSGQHFLKEASSELQLCGFLPLLVYGIYGSDVTVQATNWLADRRTPRLVRHALTALSSHWPFSVHFSHMTDQMMANGVYIICTCSKSSSIHVSLKPFIHHFSSNVCVFVQSDCNYRSPACSLTKEGPLWIVHPSPQFCLGCLLRSKTCLKSAHLVQALHI